MHSKCHRPLSRDADTGWHTKQDGHRNLRYGMANLSRVDGQWVNTKSSQPMSAVCSLCLDQGSFAGYL